MTSKKIAFIVPALNEANTIASVIKELNEYGIVIVVDDASIDDTAKIAIGAGAEVLSHEKWKGYDQAIRTGLAYACSSDYEWAVTVDADGQHIIDELVKEIFNVEEDVQMLIGTRTSYPRIMERIYAFMFNKIFLCRDPLCGLRGYKISAIRELIGNFNVGYKSFGTQILIYLLLYKLSFKEIPVHIKERKDASRFGRNFAVNLQMLKSLFIGLGIIFKEKK